jgi:transcriptional regulator with XRE-family HTH domain
VSRKTEKSIDAHIGSRLRLRRLMLGISQESLGERLSVTFQQIQKYEKGTNRVSASRLYEMAQIFDVPIDYFFDGLTGEEDHLQPQGMQESEAPSVSPYLAFVSSAEGLQLNQAFLDIGSAALRRDLLTLITDLSKAIPMRR